MIISIVKRYCICGGPANIGDIIETTPNEHMVEVSVNVKKKPMANIITRGTGSARLVAHNLPFDHRKNASADDFTMLYADSQDSPQEFWSIEVLLGEKATLVLLTTDHAEKLFTELPKKLYLHAFLFDPEGYQRHLAEDRTANMILQEEEKEMREQEEWNSMGPIERFLRSEPLPGRD